MDRMTFEHDLIPLEGLLEEKLRLKSGRLARRLSKARRRVPRRLRKDVDFLLQADYLTQNPRLTIMVNEARFQGAVRALSAYLVELDPVKERRNRVLNFAALVGLYVLMIGALAVSVLYWRGLL